MSIDNLTVGQLKELGSMFGRTPQLNVHESFFEVGKNYFIRTVTHHHTGRCIRVAPTFIVLIDAAWIADDGRFANAMLTGDFSEVEPYPDGAEVCVSLGALIDAVECKYPLPKEQK